MKRIAVFCSLLMAGTLARANSYSTTFSNLAAEVTNWVQGGAVGNNWNNVAFTSEFAYGLQPDGIGNEQYADASAVLAGTWGQNQTATATVKINRTVTSGSAEVELRLNTTIAEGNITGYEFNCSTDPNQVYAQIVRWNGPLGNFTEIGWANTTCTTGDVLTAQRSGNQLLYFKNGKQIASATDTTYMAGAPGLGFFNNVSASAEEDFGFSAFSATDGLATRVVNPSVQLSWTPVNLPVNVLRAQGSNCSSATYSQVASFAAGVSSYLDTSVAPGVTYCYVVLPVNGSIQGSATYAEQVTPSTSPTSGTAVSGPTPPAAVAGFTANVVN